MFYSNVEYWILNPKINQAKHFSSQIEKKSAHYAEIERISFNYRGNSQCPIAKNKNHEKENDPLSDLVGCLTVRDLVVFRFGLYFREVCPDGDRRRSALHDGNGAHGFIVLLLTLGFLFASGLLLDSAARRLLVAGSLLRLRPPRTGRLFPDVTPIRRRSALVDAAIVLPAGLTIELLLRRRCNSSGEPLPGGDSRRAVRVARRLLRGLALRTAAVATLGRVPRRLLTTMLLLLLLLARAQPELVQTQLPDQRISFFLLLPRRRLGGLNDGRRDPLLVLATLRRLPGYTGRGDYPGNKNILVVDKNTFWLFTKIYSVHYQKCLCLLRETYFVHWQKYILFVNKNVYLLANENTFHRNHVPILLSHWGQLASAI